MAKVSKQEAVRQVSIDPRLKNVDMTVMPEGGFEKVLRQLVMTDGWSDLQVRRDKLFRAEKQAWANGNAALVNTLEQQMTKHDDKMGRLVFYSLLNMVYDLMSQEKSKLMTQRDFQEKYVHTDEERQRYQRYEEAWFKAMFLLDIVDGYITDAVGALQSFNKEVGTMEFSDITEIQKIIKSHNYQARRYVHQDICDLQNGFIDSIQEFVDSQMDTYMPSLAMLREELKRKGEIKDGYDDIAKNKTLDR